MADSESNGSGPKRHELALVEIEALCANMLADLNVLKTSIECVLAEAKEARRR
jgi:hypothetical protein